ncbi:uncharacterized protein GLRG_00651 [Colletotrichum graminicola M1.001]|uniref:Uncharacterized protein n=1 Tax=Colletotrichum graminicola (strain M1.001 / M2 / FGSC 10212) TaxID=645133 RepID=E3Q3A5_COLGM|nr:uncharacterized protein GLRG_00651 [Colletotrichum graminicola M1.001]EFQ25507.1 hypothetical protein GLRG_00651 [Colletotrichum graminicola M1.001]
MSSASNAAALGMEDVLVGAGSIHRRGKTVSRCASETGDIIRGRTRTTFPRLCGRRVCLSLSLYLNHYRYRDRNQYRKSSRCNCHKPACFVHKRMMVCGNLYPQPENRNWRADPRAHRRRPQEGARAWPIFEIHPEDPQCNHHLPTSWEVENMNNRPMPPQCIFCRSRDGAVYFRCQAGSDMLSGSGKSDSSMENGELLAPVIGFNISAKVGGRAGLLRR